MRLMKGRHLRSHQQTIVRRCSNEIEPVHALLTTAAGGVFQSLRSVMFSSISQNVMIRCCMWSFVTYRSASTVCRLERHEPEARIARSRPCALLNQVVTASPVDMRTSPITVCWVCIYATSFRICRSSSTVEGWSSLPASCGSSLFTPPAGESAVKWRLRCYCSSSDANTYGQ